MEHNQADRQVLMRRLHLERLHMEGKRWPRNRRVQDETLQERLSEAIMATEGAVPILARWQARRLVDWLAGSVAVVE